MPPRKKLTPAGQPEPHGHPHQVRKILEYRQPPVGELRASLGQMDKAALQKRLTELADTLNTSGLTPTARQLARAETDYRNQRARIGQEMVLVLEHLNKLKSENKAPGRRGRPPR